jgi:UDP-GlcNAc:undecaprenyl-phosphate/decaprenyl-phosphate GlcNAc-1-phosphate transferase
MINTGLYLIVLAFTLGVFIAVMSIPPIIRVARTKKLFDFTGSRRMHHETLPRLGGVAIFLGFTLSTVLSSDGLPFECLKCITASVLLMFFVGLMDDMVSVSAVKKFMVQVMAALIVTLIGGIRITSLHGIFGVYSIHPAIAVVGTAFLILTLINSFNLIDGIDGLASGLALFASLFFGSWFFNSGYYEYAIMAFALAGSLAGFFLFNVFGHRNKLIMGDNGSLVIGLLVAVLAIQFNELHIAGNTSSVIKFAPVVSFAVVSIPMADMLRVMVIRIINRRSPFSADTGHIHHLMLKTFHGHLTVTIILVLAQVAIVWFALAFSWLNLPVLLQFAMVFLLTWMVSLLPSLVLWLRGSGGHRFHLPIKI